MTPSRILSGLSSLIFPLAVLGLVLAGCEEPDADVDPVLDSTESSGDPSGDGDGDPSGDGDGDPGCLGAVVDEQSCSACGLTWENVTLVAVESVSMGDDSWELIEQDDRVLGYSRFSRISATFSEGYVGFDVREIDDSARILGGRLSLYHRPGLPSPTPNTSIELITALANDWSFETAQVGDLSPASVISETYEQFEVEGYNVFEFDPGAWDYAADLDDDWMTLGIDEIHMEQGMGEEYWVQFDGASVVGFEPYVELDLCH